MRNIIVNYNAPDIDHHKFYYVEGKKSLSLKQT